LSIALGPELGGDHENDFLAVVHLVEEAVFTDAVAPGFGPIAAKFLDILPEIGLLPEAGINERPEFPDDLFFRGAEVLPKVVLESFGLEDTEITQRIALSSCGPGRCLP
jgi:hypothetical protein